jgi:hypothetical protein
MVSILQRLNHYYRFRRIPYNDLSAKAEIKIKTNVPLTGPAYTHMVDESIKPGHILQAGAMHSDGTYYSLVYGYQTANGSIYFQNTDSWNFSVFPTGWFIYF